MELQDVHSKTISFCFLTREEFPELTNVWKPVRRRALRKRQLEEEISSEEDVEEDDGDDLDTSSSSTCEEAVYDTGTASVMYPDTVVFCYEGPSRPIQLSCIEEASCLSNSLDSPTGLEDIVIHYDNDEMEDINGNKTGDDDLVKSNEIRKESLPSPKSENNLRSSQNNDEVEQIHKTSDGKSLTGSELEQSKSYSTHPLDIPEGSIRRRGYRHYVSVTEEGDFDNNGRIRPSAATGDSALLQQRRELIGSESELRSSVRHRIDRDTHAVSRNIPVYNFINSSRGIDAVQTSGTEVQDYNWQSSST
ncbi:hypothetical protein ACTXT7_000084 [Hymenolepis weldensis]